MGGKKPLRRPLWPPTRATASNYYPLGLDGAGGAAKPLLRAPKKPAPLHGRLPAFSGAVDAFERARKCFLEWRYFFSIILSEFLKNRVALQLSNIDIVKREIFFFKERLPLVRTGAREMPPAGGRVKGGILFRKREYPLWNPKRKAFHCKRAARRAAMLADCTARARRCRVEFCYTI